MKRGTTWLTSSSGIFVYTVLNGLIAAVVYLSGGRLAPQEYELKEYWTWKGTGHSPWYIRAIQNHKNARNQELHSEATEVPEIHPEEENPDSIALETRPESSAKSNSLTHSEAPISPTTGGGSDHWVRGSPT